ncbi:MAG TPA: hypothetical protein VF245_02010 [Solirubrobacterales bacterium]
MASRPANVCAGPFRALRPDQDVEAWVGPQPGFAAFGARKPAP